MLIPLANTFKYISDMLLYNKEYHQKLYNLQEALLKM